MPDTDDYQSHGHHGARFPKYIHENLNHRLLVLGVQSLLEVLNAEEEAKDKEESKDGADCHGHDDADGCIATRVSCLFAEMGAGIEACDGILAEQDTNNCHICWTCSDAPTWIACAIVECCKHEFGALVCWCFGNDCDGQTCDSSTMENDA